MKPAIDLSLHLVTDRTLCGKRDLVDVVLAAVAGGVTIVQLREKHMPRDELVLQAKALKQALHPTGVPLLINDYVHVALAAGADGVHVGQSDSAYPEARRALGPDAIIGLSVENMAQAKEAEAWDVDYLGVSPVHATLTKTDTAAPWGLEGLRKLRSATRHKLVAIGGMNESTVGKAVRSGADGIAIVSAIMAAHDPEAAARQIRLRMAMGSEKTSHSSPFEVVSRKTI